MKILERYVFGSFLVSFLLAFLVLSFVLTIGLMVQIVSFILDGVPMRLVGEFAAVSFPETLQWTMPLALLVSSVLVFSRLSADSEVAAMRACGVHLVSVIRYPVLFAVVCTVLGAVVNNEIVPRGHEIRRSLKSKVSVGTGLEVLEPGRVIDDFPKTKLYFSGKEGNWLYDLVIMDYSDPRVERMITASKALVTSEGRDINLDLYQMTIDPVDAEHKSSMHVNRYRHVVKDALKDSKYRRKDKDFRFREVLEELGRMDAMIEKAAGSSRQKGTERYLLKVKRSDLTVELMKRFVFALASICFVLVGVPLGIKSQRKESTVGMAISLGVSLGYYLIVMLMLSLDGKFAIRPELLIFLPVVFSFAFGAWLLRKNL